MNSIILSQYSFGLAPKIFNAINMIATFGKVRGMVNTFMVKAADIQRIARAPRASINDAIWLDFTGNYEHQRVDLGIRNHDRIHLSLALKNTFSCRTSTSFSFTNTTKIAFIQFNATVKHVSTFLSKISFNNLSDFLIGKNGGRHAWARHRIPLAATRQPPPANPDFVFASG